MVRNAFSAKFLAVCTALSLSGPATAQDKKPTGSGADKDRRGQTKSRVPQDDEPKVRDHRAGQDPNMQRAMDAVFGAKGVEQLKVLDHKFNMRPAKITVANDVLKPKAGEIVKPGQPERIRNTVTIKGTFSHFLRLRDDDEVKYTIKKVDGRIVDIKVDVDASSMQAALSGVKDRFVDNPKHVWEVLVRSATGNNAAVKPATKPADPKAQRTALDQALAEVSELDKKGWQGAAGQIIANIAVRADSKGRDGVVSTRKEASSYIPPPAVKPGENRRFRAP